MQFIEKMIKIFSYFLKDYGWKTKYKHKKLKNLKDILKSNSWIVIDLRNQAAYYEHHLQGTVNIPALDFFRKYYKHLKPRMKILLISNDYRSNLNIYNSLKKKRYNPYVLYAGYKEIRNNSNFDNLTKVNII
ncbi:rhodanese-like domain-containing protein [Spiroplasma endosymbiont of Crioceris asparagi]|uniref:rhodanese-like domain-containing protein n=1 Tax=Spiroplasma endosymbiont of Crioceris asparagi TaxID=3066286 RepID=UPI0030CC92A3